MKNNNNLDQRVIFCISRLVHLTCTDNDGYCYFCGFQEGAEAMDEAMAEATREATSNG